MKSKIAALTNILKDYRSVAVALSGGLDSSVLLHFATSVLGAENCAAITADTPQMPRAEIESAKKICAKLQVRLFAAHSDKIAEQIRDNPPDRCYICKRAIFTKFAEICAEKDLGFLCDGTNTDDLSDYRPGMKAIAELGVRSPLLEAEWSKADIRRYAVENKLDCATMQSNACLMTRFETNAKVSEQNLAAVENAENFIKSLGFSQVRVRVAANSARIELAPDELVNFYDAAKNLAPKISEFLKRLGFARISLDIDGYRSKSINK